jgi:hypothetical protein
MTDFVASLTIDDNDNKPSLLHRFFHGTRSGCINHKSPTMIPTMNVLLLWKTLLIQLLLLVSNTDAYVTGAGSCISGTAAVGEPHKTADIVQDRDTMIKRGLKYILVEICIYHQQQSCY